MHEKEITAAMRGRAGSDRMAAGLSIIPGKIRGDLDVVLETRNAVRAGVMFIEKFQDEIVGLKELLNTRSVPANIPSIICLCGSTRFMQAFFDAGWKFTLEGKIVLSVGVCKHAEHHGAEALGQDVANQLDELHLRKIDLADSVYVLNVGGYIGESTRKEIEYAEAHNKPIEYLEKGGK